MSREAEIQGRPGRKGLKEKSQLARAKCFGEELDLENINLAEGVLV